MYLFIYLHVPMKEKCALDLTVDVLSRIVLIGDTIFMSPDGDGTAILYGHPSHAKVSPLAGQRQYLRFSVRVGFLCRVIFTCVLV